MLIYDPPLVGPTDLTVKVQWLIPYGLGWPENHSLDAACAPPKTDRLARRGRTCTCLIVPEEGVRMPLHEWHNKGLDNVIGVPFCIQVCPPQVWLSLWMT